MSLDKRQFESSIIAILHRSREAKLTFLAERQFKTTVLAVTVDLVAADRLSVWTANINDNAKFVISVLLLLLNLLVIFYLFAKKSSYSDTKEEFISFDAALHSSILIKTQDPVSSGAKIKTIKQWFSDGTHMFCMIIIFAAVSAMIAIWGNLIH